MSHNHTRIVTLDVTARVAPLVGNCSKPISRSLGTRGKAGLPEKYTVSEEFTGLPYTMD